MQLEIHPFQLQTRDQRPYRLFARTQQAMGCHLNYKLLTGHQKHTPQKYEVKRPYYELTYAIAAEFRG